MYSTGNDAQPGFTADGADIYAPSIWCCPARVHISVVVDGVLKQSGQDYSISVSFPDAVSISLSVKCWIVPEGVAAGAGDSCYGKNHHRFSYNNLTTLQYD